jgi:hypothetical protein
VFATERSEMAELLTLRHLTNRQSTPTRALAILVGIPPRPLAELLANMRSAGLVRSSVRCDRPQGESRQADLFLSARTEWEITPVGRGRLSDAIRRGVI